MTPQIKKNVRVEGSLMFGSPTRLLLLRTLPPSSFLLPPSFLPIPSSFPPSSVLPPPSSLLLPPSSLLLPPCSLLLPHSSFGSFRFVSVRPSFRFVSVTYVSFIVSFRPSRPVRARPIQLKICDFGSAFSRADVHHVARRPSIKWAWSAIPKPYVICKLCTPWA